MESDKLFTARLDDLLRGCERGQIGYSAFLTPEEAALADDWLKANARDVLWRFDGGHPDAERQILEIRPDYLPENAGEMRDRISALEIRCSGFGPPPDHRAYLGSLTALGIKRESLGDLLCMEGFAVVFVTPTVSRLLLSDPPPLVSVGRERVKVLPATPERIAGWSQKYDEITVIVASVRIDCIVAEVAKISREKAKAAILQGDVQKNHRVCAEVSLSCVPGDVLSVRGHGKYKITDIGSTKKDRVRLTLLAYR